jgi:hypothetical protein
MCPVACREDVDNVQEVPASSIRAATTPSTPPRQLFRREHAGAGNDDGLFNPHT